MKYTEEFITWAKTEGLIQELHGIRSVNSMCNVAFKAFQAARATPAQPMSEHNARFAIDGAIQYGREKRNKPPSDDHWLMEYWLIGQQLRELGKTGWDNRTPLDPAERPSPSSVGATITDQKITDLANAHDCGRAPSGHRLFSDYNLIAFSRALLSEAAALAEQVPEGYVLVPAEPTAEMIAACDFSPAILSAVSKPAFVAAYKCMVAAAPSIAQDGQKSEDA